MRWFRDTLTRRFALAVLLSVMVEFALVAIATTLAGVWASEPLEESGLLSLVGNMTQIVEASPPDLRQTLCDAARTPEYSEAWRAQGSPTANWLDAHGSPHQRRSNELGTILRHSVKVMRSDDRDMEIPDFDYDRKSHPLVYFLAVRLPDHSWLIFAALKRSWGISRREKFLVAGLIFLLTIALVSLHAGRQLARPIVQLAEAVRRFSGDKQAAPMVEEGPQEVRQMIHSFNEMQAQIQKFISDRTAMLAAISHDLRTPLTRLRLRGEYIEDPKQQARLFSDVDELQHMVDGALAFFQEDPLSEDAVAFDLPGLLQTVANDYADQGLDVRYEGPIRASYRGRPFALRRVMANLVDNAIRYATPPLIALEVLDDAFIIAVSDQGPGIPEESIERVFKPYYRLEKSRNRATGGVGLGLTSAQAIVHAHGGEITLANRASGGLEARVSLPKG